MNSVFLDNTHHLAYHYCAIRPMKAEKIILSFVAVLFGLIAAGVAFYYYQSTKSPKIAQNPPTISQAPLQPSPTPIDTNILTIESPKEEEVVTKKLITISGKTVKGAIVTVSTEDSDQVVKPADNGEFTLTQTIPDGTTQLQFHALFPDGAEKKVTRTVTYSTESF